MLRSCTGLTLRHARNCAVTYFAQSRYAAYSAFPLHQLLLSQDTRVRQRNLQKPCVSNGVLDQEDLEGPLATFWLYGWLCARLDLRLSSCAGLGVSAGALILSNSRMGGRQFVLQSTVFSAQSRELRFCVLNAVRRCELFLDELPCAIGRTTDSNQFTRSDWFDDIAISAAL